MLGAWLWRLRNGFKFVNARLGKSFGSEKLSEISLRLENRLIVILWVQTAQCSSDQFLNPHDSCFMNDARAKVSKVSGWSSLCTESRGQTNLIHLFTVWICFPFSLPHGTGFPFFFALGRCWWWRFDLARLLFYWTLVTRLFNIPSVAIARLRFVTLFGPFWFFFRAFSTFPRLSLWIWNLPLCWLLLTLRIPEIYKWSTTAFQITLSDEHTVAVD